VSLRLGADDPVWYVAYGSNLLADRFACYLVGGHPPGARRTYDGCRDRTPFRRSVALRLTGRLRFGAESGVWGGAMAFLDHRVDEAARDEPGDQVAARAYLVTFGQFSDIVAQEARRPLGEDLALDGTGRRWPTPSRVYDSVVHVDDLDGAPMLSLTSLRPRPPAAPNPAYLRAILAGLGETFGWTPSRRADYLLAAPGVAPTWTRERLVRLSPR
jgi:hypothetical protein